MRSAFFLHPHAFVIDALHNVLAIGEDCLYSGDAEQQGEQRHDNQGI
jgi:hypothetical protein